MRLILAVAIFFSLNLFASDYPEMTAYDGCIPSKYSCEYYQCQEEKRNCGPESYLVNFGYRFCQKFLSGNNSWFTGKGQKWLYDVRECLQQKMEDMSLSLTCDELKDEAFESHIPCYLETGFCSLSLPDKVRIFNRLKASFINVKVIASGLSVMKDCFTPEEKRVIMPLIYLDREPNFSVK